MAMKKAATMKDRATTRRAQKPKDLPLRAKSARAAKGGIVTAIVPCVKTIIPCFTPGVTIKG